MNLANILTISRILIIPIIVLIYYLPFHEAHLIAAILFALAAITDWLDGYVARVWDLSSKLGAFLDPVADKLIVAVALVMIVGEVPIPFIAIPAAIIVGREIVISALREWMAELGKRASVAVSYVGKVKTMIQMISVTILLAYDPEQTRMFWSIIGFIFLLVAAALTLWSMFMYLKAAWPDLLSAR